MSSLMESTSIGASGVTVDSPGCADQAQQFIEHGDLRCYSLLERELGGRLDSERAMGVFLVEPNGFRIADLGEAPHVDAAAIDSGGHLTAIDAPAGIGGDVCAGSGEQGLPPVGLAALE